MRDVAGERSMPEQERAVVAVLRRGELFLVHRRAPGVTMPGYWAPLSGGLEPGETQAEAVVREVREEVGLTVSARRQVWESDTHDGAYRLSWWLVEESDPEAELRPDPAEVAEIRWVTTIEFATMTPTFVDDQYFFRTVAPVATWSIPARRMGANVLALTSGPRQPESPASSFWPVPGQTPPGAATV